LAGWSQQAGRAQDKDPVEPKDTTPAKDVEVEGRTVKQWLQILDGKDRKESYRAAAALAKAGPKAAEAVPVLEKMQKDDPDAYKKNLASYALAYIKPEEFTKRSAPELIAFIKAPENSAIQRSVAAAHLAKMGPQAGEQTCRELVAILTDDKDPYARALAAYALPYLKPTVDAGAPLAEALKDENQDVARQAATSLTFLGEKARGTATAVLPLCESKDPSKRALAAYVLGNIKPDRNQVLPALQKLAKDKNPSVAQAAQEALKKVDQLPARLR
jgi:HEAT repeat protein